MKKRYILFAVMAILLIGCIGAIVVAGTGDLEDKTGWQRTVYAIVNREKIIQTKFEGTVSEYRWNAQLEYRPEDHATVQKTPGEDFVIMNVTDLHMADYSLCAVTNIRNLQNVRRMAEELQPDLITLSGDIFWTNMSDGTCVFSAYRLTEFMDSLGIPWAPIFGNHDAEGNCDLNYLADIMMQGEYCLMQKGDPAMGVGNYAVNICEGDEIVHTVVMMDNHESGELTPEQVEWFRWIAENTQTAATVVMHQPIAQYAFAYEQAWDAENNCWKEGYEAFGAKREDYCGPTDENGQPLDNGLFAVIRDLGCGADVLCGHDHVNSYSVVYEGVRLTYSLRLGYGAYFDHDNFNCQGVTTLTVGAGGETQVRHHSLYPGDAGQP